MNSAWTSFKADFAVSPWNLQPSESPVFYLVWETKFQKVHFVT